MKKFLSLVFIGVVGFGFAGCQSDEDKAKAEKEAQYKALYKNDVNTSFLRSTTPNPNEKK